MKFDLQNTIRQVNTYYKNLYEMDVKDVKQKPDFYNFFTGLFTCEKCGERYRFFHFFHNPTHI